MEKDITIHLPIGFDKGCRVLLYRENSKRDEFVELLKESGYGKGEAFYRVAQAISETFPNESKEKKLLDGFLAGKERLREEITKEISATKQTNYFDEKKHNPLYSPSPFSRGQVSKGDFN